MKTIWNWLVKAWQTVCSLAPWKGLFLAWLLQVAFMLLLDLATHLCGWTMPYIIHLLISVGALFFICYKVVYPRVYPNGWQR